MICEKCGNEHDGTYGSGRFCSANCATKYSISFSIINEYKNAICVLCGKKTTIPKKASLKFAKCKKCKPRKYEYCLYCGNKLVEKNQKFCNAKCDQNFRYKNYIKNWKAGKVNGNKSNGTAVSDYVRRYLWEKYNNQCSRCGWNIPNPITGKPILEIEHINGDSENTTEENIDLICPNCHSLTITYKALNIGNGNKKRLKAKGLI